MNLVTMNFNGELMTGNLPLKKVKLVQAWIVMHEEDLMANWELATNEKIFSE